MSLSNVFMFSGQGGQCHQVGRSSYDQGGTFTRHMDWLDGMVSTFIRHALPPAPAWKSAVVMTPHGHDLEHLASLLESAA